MKKLTLPPEEISLFINLAIASAKLQTLRTPYESIRPNLHLVISGAIGSGKSSILKGVCQKLNITPIAKLTAPTMQGSVDKNTGIPIPPEIWTARNSLLCLDEFSCTKEDKSRYPLSELLSLLEFPYYRKPIGYRCNPVIKKDKDLYYKVGDNGIEVKTRFTFFANTMQDLTRPQRLKELEALRTRCLVLPFNPDREELKKILNGKKLFTYKNIKVPKTKTIKNKDYLKIQELVDSYDIPNQLYMRTVGDLCRIFALIGYREGIFYILLKLRENEIVKNQNHKLNIEELRIL